MSGAAPGKLLEVIWRDSTIPHRGWTTITGALRDRVIAVTCRSVGFVLADDETGISLASSVHGAEVAGVVHIPRGAVVSRRRLR